MRDGRLTIECIEHREKTKPESSTAGAVSMMRTVRQSMRISHLIGSILLTWHCAVLGAESPAKFTAFSQLRNGDNLMARFETRGCFHRQAYELTFSKAARLTVSILQVWNDSQGTRIDLGSLTLSKSDIAGLERLMKFYRSDHKTLSTTRDTISFTHSRDGRTVAVAEFEDCSGESYRIKKITTVRDLVARLTPDHR